MPVPVEALDPMNAPDPRRRTALSGAISVLLLRAIGSAGLGAGPAVARALTKRLDSRLLTITYPGGPSIRFDTSYYRDHHTKLFMAIYGSAIERFELRAMQADQEAQTRAAAFSALINIWIADFDLFRERSTAAAYQRMGDDKKNFTNTGSAVQVDQVRYEAGEPRSSVLEGCECLSLLYPAGQAGSWDDEERCRAYVDGIMQLLGPKAIRRVELRQGLQQLDDGSPTYQGGVNIYVRTPRDFAAAWGRHSTALQALSTQLCSMGPVQLSTTVVGIDDTHRNK